MPRTRRLRNVRRLVRWIGRAVDRLRDGPDHSGWRTTEAEIYSSKSGYLHQEPGAGIWYTYRALGERWAGSCWIRFSDEPSARYYAGLRLPGSKVLVRYNTAVPDRSVMLESDQPDAHPVAVAMQERMTHV